jgi:hypothetical protein
MGLLFALLLSLAGCGQKSEEVGQVSPTKTLRPLFTATLTATATPLASETPAATDTPLAPTDTPLPPTDTPTDTPVVATDTPAAATAAPSTDTPIPPTATAAPATAASPTDTPIQPTQPPSAGVDFRIAEIVAFEDGSLTATGLHNVYFTVIDAGGATLDGIIVKEVNNLPGADLITGNKGPGKTEFTMWAADYKFQVTGNVAGETFSSETTHVLSVLYGHAAWDDLMRGGICSDVPSCEALGPIHFSYNVTFQRTW